MQEIGEFRSRLLFLAVVRTAQVLRTMWCGCMSAAWQTLLENRGGRARQAGAIQSGTPLIAPASFASSPRGKTSKTRHEPISSSVCLGLISLSDANQALAINGTSPGPAQS
jgi:hypothetical protein